MAKQNENRYKVMVYGVESLEFKTPKEPSQHSKFLLEFHKIKTEADFSEFDGIIFIGRTFETYSHEKISCLDKLELQKRIKQLFKLLSKRGFVGILVDRIIDSYTIVHGYSSSRYECNDTSLGKVFLNDLGMINSNRFDSKEPLRHFQILRSEFKKYLSDYGITHTIFSIPPNIRNQIKPICKIDNSYTGMIIRDKVFVLPFMTPDRDEKDTTKIFTIVAEGITNTLLKISHEIPQWLEKEFIFPNERTLLSELYKQQQVLQEIESKVEVYRQFKGCLAFSDELLVDEVALTLENYFQIRVTKSQEFREDLQIHSPKDDKIIALVEVKGVNTGVAREHINQVDSHRERMGLTPDFPGILIINTKMNATSLKEKDIEVASEQIIKAVSDNILIIRTLDLLNLIVLIEKGKFIRESILELILNSNGWLKVSEKKCELIKE